MRAFSIATEFSRREKPRLHVVIAVGLNKIEMYQQEVEKLVTKHGQIVEIVVEQFRRSEIGQSTSALHMEEGQGVNA